MLEGTPDFNTMEEMQPIQTLPAVQQVLIFLISNLNIKVIKTFIFTKRQ